MFPSDAEESAIVLEMSKIVLRPALLSSVKVANSDNYMADNGSVLFEKLPELQHSKVYNDYTGRHILLL
jgi:hypothetical protein